MEMTLREKFEWDNNRSPQSAYKDGKFNPNYVEWLETDYKKETDEIIKTLKELHTKELDICHKAMKGLQEENKILVTSANKKGVVGSIVSNQNPGGFVSIPDRNKPKEPLQSGQVTWDTKGNTKLKVDKKEEG